MNNLHVKTGDNVMVISGKDKGKTGKVLQTSPKEGKVMPVCPKCGKATRVGHSVKDGKTVRVCRKCGAEL